MSEHTHTRRYLVVWLALLALTALSYLVAQIDLGAVEVFIAILIATVKTTLVALYFMHLIEQKLVVAMVGLITVAWVTLLCLGIAADVGYR